MAIFRRQANLISSPPHKITFVNKVIFFSITMTMRLLVDDFHGPRPVDVMNHHHLSTWIVKTIMKDFMRTRISNIVRLSRE